MRRIYHTLAWKTLWYAFCARRLYTGPKLLRGLAWWALPYVGSHSYSLVSDEPSAQDIPCCGDPADCQENCKTEMPENFE